MILQEVHKNVHSSGILKNAHMGFDAKGLSFVQKMLRTGMYSDKVRSLCKEVLANSIDSHVEAGKNDVPIEIFLPTRFNAVFRVVDKGLGISEEDMLGRYALICNSTKQESNDSIGTYGVGRLSPLCYTDSFTVISTHNGKKSTYSVFVNTFDLTDISQLSSEATNEPNGFEVIVAVKDKDIQEFHDKVFKICQYLKVKPVVHGATFNYENLNPIFTGKDWRLAGKEIGSVVIMGQMSFPLSDQFNNATITNLLSCGVEVEFPIGAIEITPSRESIQYSDRTKKIIADKLTLIVAEVAVEINKRFLNCVTLFDAHKMYGSVMSFDSPLYALRGMVKSNLKFKGLPITSNDINFNEPTDGSFSLRQYEKSWRGNKIKSYTYRSIDCTDQTVLVDNDLNIVSGINNRVYGLVQSGKKVYVLNYRTPADKQTFLTETGLVDSNFIKLSSLPKISLASAPGTGAKNTKHQTKEFSYDMTYYAKQKGVHSWGRRNGTNSAYWNSEKVDIQNDSGVYVILQSFEFKDKNGVFQTPYRLKEIIDSISTFITIPKIYGFKIAVEDEAKKNQKMVDLWSYIATELTAYFVKNKIAQKVSNRSEFEQNNKVDWYGWLKSHYKEVKPTTAFYKAGVIFDYMNPVTDKKVLDESVKHSEYFTSSMQPEHDLEKLVKEIENTYPLFDCIEWYQASKKKEAMITYINMIG
jgi:hypothetical protein